MDYVHKEILGLEILEIRARMTELLARCEAEDAMGNSSAWDGNIDLQATVDDEPQIIVPVALYELNAISPLSTPPDLFHLPHPQVLQGQFPDQEYSPVESIGDLPQGIDHPIGQHVRPDPLDNLHLPHDTYSEGEALSDSSVGHDQQLPLPIVQGRQQKVRCTQPGCSKVVRKDGLTRHVNETHLRTVKAVCASCGKGFLRLCTLQFCLPLQY